MNPLRKPLFWILLAIALAAAVLAPWMGAGLTLLQRGALAVLLSGSIALGGYLLVVILHPERF
ncbi:MAG: potassium-transporting ATPase subunit F [Synechococcaceae cyanobacterium]|jgi:K+-transporting ATPase KdpF subunit